MLSDRAAHSDFLIHWTGGDIDKEHDPNWISRKEGASWTNPAGREAYHARLKNILKYGLWMTTELPEKQAAIYRNLGVPSVPRLCFTELRLSESRAHARTYGRLGIGVKRPFLFARRGRPLSYFGFAADSTTDPLLQACIDHLPDKSLLNFFQPMNSLPTSPLTYDLYSESEWRLILLDVLVAKRLIIDPRDPKNHLHHEYFNTLPAAQQDKLRYLVPLDGWFAMIIYPSLTARNVAQRDHEVRDEIARIKQHKGGSKDHGNRVEDGSWPIELGLDNCREF